MLQAMAGPHPWDHTSLEAPPADYPARLDGGIAGLKVAFSPDLGHARVDSDVAALVQTAAEAFQSLGSTVESPALPFGPEGPEIIRMLWPIHLHAYRPLLAEFEGADGSRPGCLHPRGGRGDGCGPIWKTRARKLAYVEAVHRFFEEWDLLAERPRFPWRRFPAERLKPEHWPSHPWDWIMWGRVLLPLQLQPKPRRLGALRLHRCGAPGRAADRGPALRRSRRAAGRARLRAGAALGGQAPGAVIGGTHAGRHACRPACTAAAASLAGRQRLTL